MNEVISCKEFNIHGKKIKIEWNPSFSHHISFYLYKNGYFHSPYRLNIPRSNILHDSYMTTQDEILKELPKSDVDCEVGAEYDKCVNGMLALHMNKSAGCVLRNSWSLG